MNKVDFKVFGERVLIKPDDPETVSAGGIIIPAGAQGKNYWGTIVRVGETVTIGVGLGDRVYYEKYSGTEVKVNDSIYVIVKQDDVLGAITESGK